MAGVGQGGWAGQGQRDRETRGASGFEPKVGLRPRVRSRLRRRARRWQAFWVLRTAGRSVVLALAGHRRRGDAPAWPSGGQTRGRPLVWRVRLGPQRLAPLGTHHCGKAGPLLEMQGCWKCEVAAVVSRLGTRAGRGLGRRTAGRIVARLHRRTSEDDAAGSPPVACAAAHVHWQGKGRKGETGDLIRRCGARSWRQRMGAAVPIRV